jgi:hypothetical protein
VARAAPLVKNGARAENPAQGQHVSPIYSYRARVCERRRKVRLPQLGGRRRGTDALLREQRRLGVKRSEADYLRWIDAQALAGGELDKPGELHKRAASGVEDRSLDVASLALDLVGLSAYQGDLGCGWHVPQSSRLRR